MSSIFAFLCILRRSIHIGVTSEFYSLLMLNAPRFGWESFKEIEHKELIRLFSVSHPGCVIASQDGEFFRFQVTMLENSPKSVYLVPPAEFKDFLLGLALLAKRICNVEPSETAIVCEDDGKYDAGSVPFKNEVSSTESVSLVCQRLGQEVYRESLIKLWNGACALTGVNVPELLVASHAKPWCDSSDDERLDPYNGFLLESRFDRLFDQGLISFNDDGGIILSSLLTEEQCSLLGVSPNLKIKWIHQNHLPYLNWHRNRVFRA